MQRLLTEDYAEFEFEEPAKVPGSVYVKRCPKETIKEKTVMEETVDQRRLNRSRGASPGAEAPQPEQRRLDRIRGASTISICTITAHRRPTQSICTAMRPAISVCTITAMRPTRSSSISRTSRLNTFQQEDTQEGGAHDGCASSEESCGRLGEEYRPAPSTRGRSRPSSW